MTWDEECHQKYLYALLLAEGTHIITYFIKKKVLRNISKFLQNMKEQEKYFHILIPCINSDDITHIHTISHILNTIPVMAILPTLVFLE